MTITNHDTPDERQLLENFYRAFAENNLELLKSVVTPDWQDIPLSPGQGPGPEGIAPMLGYFSAAFPDMEILIHEIFGGGERVGVRAEIRGTHRAEFFGIEPTNKSVSIALHEFHYIRDGKITHTWHLEDWFGMLNQVGAWPLK
jgi:predicted ester cyclase